VSSASSDPISVSYPSKKGYTTDCIRGAALTVSESLNDCLELVLGYQNLLP